MNFIKAFSVEIITQYIPFNFLLNTQAVTRCDFLLAKLLSEIIDNDKYLKFCPEEKIAINTDNRFIFSGKIEFDGNIIGP